MRQVQILKQFSICATRTTSLHITAFVTAHMTGRYGDRIAAIIAPHAEIDEIADPDNADASNPDPDPTRTGLCPVVNAVPSYASAPRSQSSLILRAPA